MKFTKNYLQFFQSSTESTYQLITGQEKTTY